MTSHANGLIRPNYFDRQQLTAADLTAEQTYWRERLRRHNRFMHGWGVVSGAEVTHNTDTQGEIHVSEGYVVTPHGDEIYIPAGTKVDVSDELDACLGAAADPCSAVRIVDANIDPYGKDLRTDYNVEWVELLVQERMSLDGYVIQHTINPGTPRAAFEDYYTFRETTRFPFGTVIRIHSGAARHHDHPDPEMLHRYVAGEDQVGNWRLNNTLDTIRILNPDGVVVHTRTFASALWQVGEGLTTAYLIVCPCEQPACPRPLMPEECQPPGGAYEWSRACEIFRLQLICELPPSHETPLPDCDDLFVYVCGDEHVPPPPPVDPKDNGVVLATFTIQNGEIMDVDNWTHRRRLLSKELLLAYVRCQCEVVPPPEANFAGAPTAGQAPLSVAFDYQSTGRITACSWDYGDDTTGDDCADHMHVYTQPGVYTVSLTATGPGGSDTRTRSDYIRVHHAPVTIRVAFHSSFAWPFYERAEGTGFLSDLVNEMMQRLYGPLADVELDPTMNDEKYMVSVAAGTAPDLYFQRTPVPLPGVEAFWTENYFLNGLRLLVNPAAWEAMGNDPSEINAWDGTTVGVSTSSPEYAQIVLAVANQAGISLTTRAVDTIDLAFLWLVNGEIQGFAGIWDGLLQMIRDETDQFSVVGPLLFYREGEQAIGLQPRPIAVRPGGSDLRDDIDEQLVAMIGDGTWRQIYDAWFPSPPPYTPEQLLDPDLLDVQFDMTGAAPSVADLIREANEPVERASGIGPARGALLRAAGVDTLLGFASMPVERAVEVLESPERTVAQWQASAWDVIMGRT